MKIYFFHTVGMRTNAYESVSEPFGKPNYEMFLAANLKTGKVTSFSIDELEGKEVYSERMYDTFKKLLDNNMD